MKKFSKAIALVLATSFAGTALLPVASAEARDYRYHRHHGSDNLVAGAIGFAAGAIIANEVLRPRPVYRERVYVEPRPVYRERVYVEPRPVYREPRPIYAEPRQTYRSGPTVVRYEDDNVAYEPWTREWSQWCSDKYRSFNPRTGTYRGFDSRDHFCVVE